MKKIVVSRLLAPFVLLTCLTPVAQATLFAYKYTWTNTGSTLTGTLEGAFDLLDVTGQRILVTSITGTYVDGDLITPNPTFDLANTGVSGLGGDAIVTLDGSFFDLFQGTALFVDLEFLTSSFFNGARLFHPANNPCCGTLIEDEGMSPSLNGWIAAEHWSIRAVPEPGTLGLLGAGLIGLVMRRKRVA